MPEVACLGFFSCSAISLHIVVVDSGRGGRVVGIRWCWCSVVGTPVGTLLQRIVKLLYRIWSPSEPFVGILDTLEIIGISTIMVVKSY